MDVTTLSRLQFAITSLFHITWPILTIGLSLFLVFLEAMWWKTQDALYYRQARFWARLFILNFGVGVASGVPMEFQMGMNWGPFSYSSGDFVGNILGYEAAMAFMLEAGFLGIMVFGWNRVHRGIHLFATVMVAFGATLSAFWIMSANSWLQTPAGVTWQQNRLYVTDYLAAVFNPSTPWAFLHMWVACLETSIFFVAGVSAWYLLRGRFKDFAARSFRIAMLATIVLAPLQIYLGDGSGLNVREHQPAKLAAIEAHWQTNPPNTSAPWILLAGPNMNTQRNDWEVAIPGTLSLITDHKLHSQIKGLRDFPRADQPPVATTFYSFRVMVAIGFYMFFVMLWTVWEWARGRIAAEHLPRHKWLLRAWVLGTPLGFFAVYAGWITREVGRQPWLVYGLIRTRDGVSNLPAASVWTTMTLYTAIYVILYVAFTVFAVRIIRNGPDLDIPLPQYRPANKTFTELGIRRQPDIKE